MPAWIWLAVLLLATLPAHGATNRLVVAVADPRLVTGLHVDDTRVAATLATGLTELTGQPDLASALRQFVKPHDVVGLKISTATGPLHTTRRPLVNALVAGLRAAGVPATNIWVFDRDPLRFRESGFTNSQEVTIIGDTGWDADTFYEHRIVGKLIWGDLLFQPAREDISTRSHLPRLLTRRLTKVINLPVLRDHDALGVAGCLHNITLGLTDNIRRFEQPGPVADTAVAEMAALPAIRDKTVLHILDALVAGYAGGTAFKVRYSWPHARLYFSTDPVALDALALELIEEQRQAAGLSSVRPRAGHIAAAGMLGLGEANRSNITLRVLTP